MDIIKVHFYSGREEPELCGHDPSTVRDGAARRPRPIEQNSNLVTWRDRNKSSVSIWVTRTGNDVGGQIDRIERYQAAKVEPKHRDSRPPALGKIVVSGWLVGCPTSRRSAISLTVGVSG